MERSDTHRLADGIDTKWRVGGGGPQASKVYSKDRVWYVLGVLAKGAELTWWTPCCPSLCRITNAGIPRSWMTDYRRAWHPGATWFFTVNLADRTSSLLVDRVDDLRHAFRCTRHRHPFQIDALCVLPEHLHAVLTLPAGHADFALRWRLIKTEFSRRIPAGEDVSASRRRKGERSIWQRRYWEHRIRDVDDLQSHLDYTLFNPVKHGHAERVVDWKYSTFHRDVLAGRLPVDWGGSKEAVHAAGERTGISG